LRKVGKRKQERSWKETEGNSQIGRNREKDALVTTRKRENNTLKSYLKKFCPISCLPYVPNVAYLAYRNLEPEAPLELSGIWNPNPELYKEKK
jgi:hypothetical protein